jgi:hypothetical protein
MCPTTILRECENLLTLTPDCPNQNLRYWITVWTNDDDPSRRTLIAPKTYISTLVTQYHIIVDAVVVVFVPSLGTVVHTLTKELRR